MLSIQAFLNSKEEILDRINPVKIYGKVIKAVGLIVESIGVNASIGDICEIINEESVIEAEVVGFKNGTILLSPLGEIYGIRPGAKIAVKGNRATFH